MVPASSNRNTSAQFAALPFEDSLSSDECIATTSALILANRLVTGAPERHALTNAFSALPFENSLSSDETIATTHLVPVPGQEACLTNRRAPCVAPAFSGSTAATERILIHASEQGLQTRFEQLLFRQNADAVNLASTSTPLIANSIHWHVQNARTHSPDKPFAMDTRVIKRLIDLGARVNPLDATALRQSAMWMAIQQTNAHVVRLLLEHGCDPNASQALTEASQRGLQNHARVLLQYGADPNAIQDGRLPLNQACLQGDVDMAKLLLENGARMDLPDQDGKTAFMYAGLCGNKALLHLLCRQGVGLSEANLRFAQQHQITLERAQPEDLIEKHG